MLEIWARMSGICIPKAPAILCPVGYYAPSRGLKSSRPDWKATHEDEKTAGI